ncbi:hypothetical protein EDB83DRAFT_2321613 [Lactarius deliciosus]|nr:hypothetical protein EDB83DRAFT_2321613 [Lactarius deliciosus]
MSSPPPHLVYTCWAPADEWQRGFVMLGANICSIPAPPPPSDPIIGVDGFWGAHEWTIYPQMYRREFPHLAWIPLRPRKLFEEVTTKWKSIKVALEDPFHAVSSQASFSSIERPMKAYTRAFETLNRLEKDFRAWQDFVEVFRNLQRSLLELCAFLGWWKNLYADHARWSVPSYLLIPSPTLALDLARKVTLSPHKSCNVQPMSSGPLVHSLHHWYYPPLVNDVVADLETTARGYLDRLDTFRPTKELKRTFEKTENKKKDQAGHRAKKAKTDTATYLSQLNHPELKRLTSTGPAPSWFPAVQEVWTTAVGHVSHLNLAPSSSPRRFSLPPIQLFWSGNEENQCIFYYHLLLLRHALQDRRTCDLPPLTMGEWKTILGNTYWKTQWPKQDDPPTATFDPDMSTADDLDVRQAMLYYLNSFHVYEEVKAMECFRFKATSSFEKRWIQQENWVYHIAEMWDAVGGATDFKFFHNKKMWRLWLFSLHEVVMDWDGFDSWDWDGISNVKTLNIDSLLGQASTHLLYSIPPLSLFPPV